MSDLNEPVKGGQLVVVFIGISVYLFLGLYAVVSRLDAILKALEKEHKRGER